MINAKGIIVFTIIAVAGFVLSPLLFLSAEYRIFVEESRDFLIPLSIGLLGILIGAFVEAYQRKIDDSRRIKSFSESMWYMLFTLVKRISYAYYFSKYPGESLGVSLASLDSGMLNSYQGRAIELDSNSTRLIIYIQMSDRIFQIISNLNIPSSDRVIEINSAPDLLITPSEDPIRDANNPNVPKAICDSYKTALAFMESHLLECYGNLEKLLDFEELEDIKERYHSEFKEIWANRLKKLWVENHLTEPLEMKGQWTTTERKSIKESASESRKN